MPNSKLLTVNIFDSLFRYGGTCQWRVPRVVIIHMGTNDLIDLDIVQFKWLIEAVLLRCRQMLPDTIFIWSDILPRAFYQGARSQKGIDQKRKHVNKAAVGLFARIEGRVIKHSNMHWYDQCLFRDDDVHLDVWGQHIFTTNLRRALFFFLRNPDELVFNPGC